MRGKFKVGVVATGYEDIGGAAEGASNSHAIPYIIVELKLLASDQSLRLASFHGLFVYARLIS
jgi:hypothetical protein